MDILRPYLLSIVNIRFVGIASNDIARGGIADDGVAFVLPIGRRHHERAGDSQR